MPASQLSIINLSEQPRLGFKGRGTLPAMQKRGIAVETLPNRAFRQADGSLCLVLAASEVLLLGARDGDDSGFAKLEADWRIEDGERTYPMPRRHSHAWFAILRERRRRICSPSCARSIFGHTGSATFR